MKHRTAVSNALGATMQGLTAAVGSIAKHHLSPLGLAEMVGFVAALALGWNEVALVILALHLVRMGLVLVRGLNGARALGRSSGLPSSGQLLAYTGHALRHGRSHGLGHGWAHGLGHGWSHGLGQRLSNAVKHRG